MLQTVGDNTQHRQADHFPAGRIRPKTPAPVPHLCCADVNNTQEKQEDPQVVLAILWGSVPSLVGFSDQRNLSISLKVNSPRRKESRKVLITPRNLEYSQRSECKNFGKRFGERFFSCFCRVQRYLSTRESQMGYDAGLCQLQYFVANE